MINLAIRLGSIPWIAKFPPPSWLIFGMSFVVGCGGAAGKMGAEGPGLNHRDTEIHHQACDIASSHAQAVDANNDGRADLTMVMDGGREVCRAADLDFDGRVDVWTYFDAGGNVSRREFDYDRDGAIDEIQIFAGGQVVEKQRASTLSHHLDTWEKYASGRLVSAERDSNGDGRIDQWWDYKSADCPLIHSDSDGNGQPDPNSTVDYCKETNTKPPDVAESARPEMLKKETEALPTETSNTLTPTGTGDSAKAGSSTAKTSDVPKKAPAGAEKSKTASPSGGPGGKP
jgi:hypothetical protein